MMQYLFILEFIEKCMKFINGEMIGALRIGNNYSIDIRSTNNLRVVMKLRTLMDLYGDLCELSRKISSYYSLRLFVCIVMIFTFSLLNCYYLLQYLSIVDNYGPNSLAYCFKMMSLLILLTTLTTCVSTVLNEVNY